MRVMGELISTELGPAVAAEAPIIASMSRDYIERGLGPKWKPVAAFFAIMLGITAFMTGNAVQANTVADAARGVGAADASSAAAGAVVHRCW